MSSYRLYADVIAVGQQEKPLDHPAHETMEHASGQ
jgi:hypothetical protein